MAGRVRTGGARLFALGPGPEGAVGGAEGEDLVEDGVGGGGVPGETLEAVIDDEGTATALVVGLEGVGVGLGALGDGLGVRRTERTGQTYETIAKDTERDNFMTAQQAMEYGLIDKVIYTR